MQFPHGDNFPGTRAINRVHLCLSKTLSQNYPHAEIAFSSSRNLILIRFLKIVKWLAIIEKSFPKNHFSMIDRLCDLYTIEKNFPQNHFSMVDRSCDLSTIEKSFPQNHFSIVDRSRDLSTIEKWFWGKLFSIVAGHVTHFKAFFPIVILRSTIREWVFLQFCDILWKY